MTGSRDRDYLLGLVRELRAPPHEIEWMEFKANQRARAPSASTSPRW